MTCGDVETLLDAFLDSELPPPMLVAVARHAGGCEPCDTAIRRLTELREQLVATVEADAAAVDLSDLWSHVEQSIVPVERERRWGRRARGASVLAAGIGMAAATLLALRGVQWGGDAPGIQTKPIVARRSLPNHVYIDRLAGHNVGVQREDKSGTTIVWVNYAQGS